MKRKIFRGSLIANEDGSFAGKDGEVIEGRRLSILLSEEKGLNIFVSKVREPELFEQAFGLLEDAVLDIEVEYKINNNGSLTYIPIRIIEQESEHS